MPVDLTLPSTASPTIDPYQHEPMSIDDYALYTHVDLSEEEIDEVLEECNSRYNDDPPQVVRAPKHNMAGKPLRAAFDEQLNNVLPGREFELFYFVAVVDRDWREKGLIIVTFDNDSDEETSTVDQVRIPAADVGIKLVNLQIAKISWGDLKEG